jgi:colanic acid/amylovoran biosynthesis glycosyltransferase
VRRILSVIPGPTYGGSANQLRRLAAPLRERGWDTVAVVSTEAGNVGPRLRSAGLEVHEVTMPRLRATSDPRAHAAFVRGLGPAVSQLRQIVEEVGADVVQNHGDLNPHGALAGHRAGAAVVWQILDTRTPQALRWATSPMMLGVADAITTWGYELARGYPGVTRLGPRQITVFPPVDGEVFRPRPELRAAARAELGASEDELVVAVVANRNPQKGLEWFVRAAAVACRERPEIAPRIVGAPSLGHEEYEAGVLREAAELGLGDRLQVVDPGDRVAELMQGIDVLVLSSVPLSEGMPTVLAEAMACNVPVMATDVGAVSELITDGVNGRVVAPCDAQALGAAIAQVAGDPGLRERFARAGRELMEGELSLGACADRHAHAYEVAVAHRAGRRGGFRGRPSGGGRRVAVLADHYPELSQTFVVSEVEALRRRGVDVRVEARVRAQRPNPEAPSDLLVHHLEDDRRPAKALALAWLAATRPGLVLADARRQAHWAREEAAVTPLRVLAPLARRLATAQVDHLHVHFAAAMALDGVRLGVLLGLPCSVTAHAYEIYQEPRNLPEKLQRADFSTSGCDYTVRDLQALLPAERRDSVHRIVMGVDARAFRRTRPYPGGRTVVAVGRLVEKKGFADLLDAIAHLQDARLVIVGDGPLRGDLEARRERLGLQERVELAGALPPSEVREWLERADVLAMPCVVAADGDRDSMPVVVKEALAMEVPVVATDEVGLPELVQDGWGRLVPPHDPPALAAAIGELLALPPQRRMEMGAAGRAHVEAHCNPDLEAAALERLIEAAISARRA